MIPGPIRRTSSHKIRSNRRSGGRPHEEDSRRHSDQITHIFNIKLRFFNNGKLMENPIHK